MNAHSQKTVRGCESNVMKYLEDHSVRAICPDYHSSKLGHYNEYVYIYIHIYIYTNVN